MLLQNIVGGPSRTAWSDPRSFAAVGGTTLFTANDGVRGGELWRTDGTTSGTVLVQDIVAGAGSSMSPLVTLAPLSLGRDRGAHVSMVLANGRLLFSAEQTATGRELWTIDPGATAQRFGTSCVEPGRMLRLDSEDPVLGTVAIVSGDGALPRTSGTLLLASPEPALPVASCTLHLSPNDLLVLAPIRASTTAFAVPVPLPPGPPALLGSRAGLQAFLGPTPRRRAPISRTRCFGRSGADSPWP